MESDARTQEETHAGTAEGTDARTHADVQAYTLTVDAAAAILGKSDDTVRRYIRAGKLPAMRVQGERTIEYRVRPDDAEDLRAQLAAVDAQAAEPAASDAATPAAAPSPLPSPAPATDAGMQARTVSANLMAVTQALVQPLVEELHQTHQQVGDLREQLGRERALREAAEQRLQALEHQRQDQRDRRQAGRLPWWLRLLLGGR